MATISIPKLVAVAILGLLLIFLCSLVVTLQIIVVRRRQLQFHNNKRNASPNAHSKTVTPSNAISEETELYLWKKYAHIPQDTESASRAYWNQAAAALSEWDATLEPNFDAPVNYTHALYSLQQASQLGNANAQYHVANALSSGVWPIDTTHKNKLIVSDDMFSYTESQTIQAQLLWHMSAMDGHVDSAVALGYRRLPDCSAALPYYESAAHLIMDHLEATTRAKIHPPLDKHVLPQIHMHGGTSSSLKMHNKPDEPAEALQYYHLRATGTAADLGAAFTLAHYYHYGLRGVDQNLELALKYYEIAAKANHWEAAAQAGMFYFWAFGCERDLAKAHKYFRKGAPGGLEGCTQMLKNSKKSKDRTATCDATALNGMGLLQLHGIPHMIPLSYDKARRYFKLAKQSGNADAVYNLAMMDLGHKERFVASGDLPEEDRGQTLVDPLMTDWHKKPYKGPSKNTIASAVFDLVVAANKGHLQARHRLGMMYANGVKLENVAGQAVVKDCNKAILHYKYIVDLASPTLAQRTRTAYRQYMAGDYENSLRNYLAAAETGSEVAQVNAAFLLEQKTCLGLSELDCARASVRLWKAAAKRGSTEASLRVGDFYYYGRLRQEQDEPISPIGPRLWLQYVVYPERMLPFVQSAVGRAIQWVKSKISTGKEVNGVSEDAEAPVCDAGEDKDGTCILATATKDDKQQSQVKSDLTMAAHYYRIAAEQHNSPRANFNLGFMHEWGLGLTQDFPLAKRHYDLASPEGSNTNEGEVPVQIALMFLNMHENFVKLKHAWDEWWLEKGEIGENTQVPTAAEAGVGHPVPVGKPQHDVGSTTRAGVIISHLVSWESLLIIVLTIVLSKLVQHRRTRPR